MYMPRCRLTPKEAERWTVYAEPDKKQKALIYRVYNGELNFSQTIKEDTENIQISRRSRVVALTASGDLFNAEINIFDSSGEQYTMGFTPFANLLPGANSDPRGAGSFDPALDAFFEGRRLAMGGAYAHFFTLAPHVFEPNIVLEANQTLSIKGRNLITLLDTSEDDDPASHVSFCLHVWEFPIE